MCYRMGYVFINCIVVVGGVRDFKVGGEFCFNICYFCFKFREVRGEGSCGEGYSIDIYYKFFGIGGFCYGFIFFFFERV